MKRCGLIFFLTLLFLIIEEIFCYCIYETRNLSDYTASNGSYFPTIYNKSLVDDCGCQKEFTCVRKCCDEDYVFDDEGWCSYDKTAIIAVPIFQYGNVIIDDENLVNFRYISGFSECLIDGDASNQYMEPLEDFFIQKDGRLWIPKYKAYFSHDHYCLEYTEDYGPVAHICVVDYDVQGLEVSDRITFIGMIISLPFLLVTFVVYAILPLRNLHGKSLMCYVFALFWTYLLCVLIYLYPEKTHLNSISCRFLAMSFYYFFESSFFWMNVMCIDIYLTFSGARGFSVNKKRQERRRFIIYSIYAWITPLIFVAIVLVLSDVFKPYRWFNPGVTDEQCWLNDGIPTFLYLYLPMACLIFANVTLFAITACKIRKVQQDTAMLRTGDNKTSKNEEKIRFVVYLKLFLAMGVNWSLEIVAWLIDWQVERVPPAVWYVMEFCNAAFGVFIFFIFVFKRNVWKLLKKRYYTMIGKPELAGSLQTESSVMARTSNSVRE